MSFDLPPQRKLTLNKMALGVLQPRTGQTIGVRTLVFLYSYLYGLDPVRVRVRVHPPRRSTLELVLVLQLHVFRYLRLQNDPGIY